MKQILFIVLLVVACFGENFKEQDLKACKIINASEEFEYTTKLCKGIGEYKLILDSDDLRENLTIINGDGIGFSLDLWRHYSGFSKIEKILWKRETTQYDSLQLVYAIFKNEIKKQHIIDIQIYSNKVCFLGKCISGKRMLGKITNLVNGDRGCYISLDGSRDILGEYELCESDKYLKKDVYLTYTPVSVQSPECQGDPACKKYETITIVDKVIEVNPEDTCKSLLFACTDQKNKVTLCENKNKETYLLSYKSNSFLFHKEQLKGNSTAYSGGGAAWLNLDNRFIVYTGIGKWGKNGALMEKQGIYGEENLQCSRLLKSEIGPQWFEDNGIIKDNTIFTLP